MWFWEALSQRNRRWDFQRMAVIWRWNVTSKSRYYLTLLCRKLYLAKTQCIRFPTPALISMWNRRMKRRAVWTQRKSQCTASAQLQTHSSLPSCPLTRMCGCFNNLTAPFTRLQPQWIIHECIWMFECG